MKKNYFLKKKMYVFRFTAWIFSSSLNSRQTHSNQTFRYGYKNERNSIREPGLLSFLNCEVFFLNELKWRDWHFCLTIWLRGCSSHWHLNHKSMVQQFSSFFNPIWPIFNKTAKVFFKCWKYLEERTIYLLSLNL